MKLFKYVLLILAIFAGIGVLVIAFSQQRREGFKVLENLGIGVGRGKNVAKTYSEGERLTIDYLLNRNYTPSKVKIERFLGDRQGYKEYIASYLSDGLKIYALLTVPKTGGSDGKYPAIVFNHGYIPPSEYRTTERYEKFVDALSKAGYIVFKIDYRGHGESEGEPEGGYTSNAYVIDSINAIEALKNFEKVDPSRIGIFGHSMGGWITSRVLVVKGEEVKAAVIWAGVLGSYKDLFEVWLTEDNPSIPAWRRGLGEELEARFEPRESPFWEKASITGYIQRIKAPIQLHHAKTDKHVPFELSKRFYELLKKEGKEVELYSYEYDDHNLSRNFPLAMRRTIEFFDRYLK